MLPDLKQLRRVVREAAQEVVLPKFAVVQRHVKHDGSLVTEVDLAMQARMQRDLEREWPDFAFLGEEMTQADMDALMQAPRTGGMWVLDPVDGTSNFAAGVPYFAVSLALLVDGRPEIGIVYDPVRDECFAAQRGRGAWLNGISLGTAPTGLPLRRCIAGVDFKRLRPALAAHLGANPPYGSQRNFGASSLDWCWLADGRIHLYLHGGQKLWDYVAGHLILLESAGHARTFEDEDVFAFNLCPRSVIAAREAGHFDAWRGWVSEQLRAAGS
jgi:myo-inositol-1(or 4)-monophosphatase